MFITGVIGYPLKTTYSPLLHNSAFKSLSLKGYYFPLCIPERDFEMIIKTIKKVNFTGFNITNPYKTKILRYLDGFSPVVKKIGSANTVLIKRQKLFGGNTDIYGFDISLKEHNINLNGKKILLIGAGGVARAIAYVIGQKVPESFFIANRTKEKALLLAKKYNANVIDMSELSDVVKQFDIVINATSIDIHNKIIPHLKCNSVYYDTNYHFDLPQNENLKVINGLKMLIIQAAYSFSIWTKKAPPVNIMKRAIKGVKID
ncbi:MAG: shikimate dehydrogenase [bacterium]